MEHRTPEIKGALWWLERCLRCFAVGDVYVSLCKKELPLHLACGEGRERYFGCTLMQREA